MLDLGIVDYAACVMCDLWYVRLRCGATVWVGHDGAVVADGCSHDVLPARRTFMYSVDPDGLVAALFRAEALIHATFTPQWIADRFRTLFGASAADGFPER